MSRRSERQTRRSGGQSKWTPASLSSAKFWAVASDSQVSGGVVSSLTPRVGSFSMTVPGGATGPTVIAGPNGSSALSFVAGSSNALLSTSSCVALPSAYTMWCVLKFPTATVAVNKYVFGNGDSTNGVAFDGYGPALGNVRGVTHFTVANEFDGATTTSWELWLATCTRGSVTTALRVNGASQTVNTATSNYVIPDTTNGRISLGCRPNVGSFADNATVQIAEAGLCDVSLSATDIAQLEAYAQSSYALW